MLWKRSSGFLANIFWNRLSKAMGTPGHDSRREGIAPSRCATRTFIKVSSWYGGTPVSK
jgi:hypothetical protein